LVDFLVDTFWVDQNSDWLILFEEHKQQRREMSFSEEKDTVPGAHTLQ